MYAGARADHRHPARRAVDARDGLDHVQQRDRVDLVAAGHARHHVAEQAARAAIAVDDRWRKPPRRLGLVGRLRG